MHLCFNCCLLYILFQRMLMTEFQLPYKALPHSEFEVLTISTIIIDEDFDLMLSNVQVTNVCCFLFVWWSNEFLHILGCERQVEPSCTFHWSICKWYTPFLIATSFHSISCRLLFQLGVRISYSVSCGRLTYWNSRCTIVTELLDSF